MKRYKRIGILLAILVVVSVAAIAAIQMEERQEQIKNSDEIVLEVARDTVQSLSWEYEDTALGFHKDEKWLYDDDAAFPVDEEKIGELLSLFEEFGVTFIIEEVEDYGQYGLDEPVCTIELATEDASYTIELGDFSKMDSQRYVSIGDGNVYLVGTDPLESFDCSLSDLIDNDEIPDIEQLTKLEFSGDESYTVTYQENSDYSYSEDDVFFTQRDGQTVPLDTSRVKSYLNDISNLDQSTYATYNATEEELESYGLDDPDLTITADFTYTNEDEEEVSDTFVLHISRDSEEKAAAEAAEDTEDSDQEETVTAYARVGQSQIVYNLTQEDYEALTAAAYHDLRHQEVFWADFEKVTQIDVELENSSYTILAAIPEEEDSDDEDAERVWTYQEEEVVIDDLQNALLKLTAEDFAFEKPTGKEEISLTVHLSDENFPQVQIQLCRYDGTNCVALVNGESVCLVLRSDVVELVEAVNGIILN